MALTVSLSLHIAVLVYAVTASTIRRDKPAAAPIVFTCCQNKRRPCRRRLHWLLKPRRPQLGARASTVRPRSDRAANRWHLHRWHLIGRPTTDSRSRRVTCRRGAPSLQGDVQVASAQTGSG